MKKFIITISREFGCNAREVARKAAAELGVEFYDKDLVFLFVGQTIFLFAEMFFGV